jgi:two-component system sensor histidine kinase/response regulator
VKPESGSVASKILVIDDEDHFRQIIIKSLTKHGFEVLAAADGEAGVALASETLPDLIVCDLNMPRMDGYEVLAALRSEPRLADIPLIFLTGESQPSRVRQGMNLGADDYLTKPVDLADLVGAIRVRLSRRQSQRQRQEKQMERAMQLFGGIVHDLRDPLFVVLGYTGMLKRGAGKAARGGEDSQRMLDRMQQAVLRMQAIISETLFLARSRMQRLPFDPGPFDLREFCEQMVADHEANPRVRFECAPGRFPLVADALRLRQALDNLLSNALKYSDGPVVVSLSAGARDYLIEVSDQGIGIPAAEQTGIFEPFFRASNTGNKPGNGLGLSIVKSCIEQHGGMIRFSSEAGKGATFFVELPRSPRPLAEDGGHGAERESGSFPVLLPEIAAPAVATQFAARAHQPPCKAPAAAPAHPGKLRGIIVDDDPLVRGLMRDLLESANDIHIVGEAGTLAQARSLAKQQGPEVVFLDVNLPDGTGFDLLPYLNPAASVVFVTSAEEYAVHAFDCEAADYLLKPVSPERLQQALARVRQRLAAKPATMAAASPKPGDSFLVKTLTEKRLVKVGEIERIIAYGEYSWVYWNKNKKGALLRKSLRHWEAELPSGPFIRVHRRAIINLAWMDRVEKLLGGRMQIHMRDSSEPILVSLRLAPVLNRKLRALRD